MSERILKREEAIRLAHRHCPPDVAVEIEHTIEAWHERRVTAERQGYERCKQDATTAIEAEPTSGPFTMLAITETRTLSAIAFKAKALAVVAALGQQQETDSHLPSVQVGTNATGANAMQRASDTREGP